MIKKDKNSISSVYDETTVIGKIYKGIAKLYESWRKLLASGIPPLTLLKCKQADLVDYKVYGESIQDGTPTPDAPIEVESVGEKTSNLIDFKQFKPYGSGQITFLENGLSYTGSYYISIDGSHLKSGNNYYMSWEYESNDTIIPVWRIQYTDNTFSSTARKNEVITTPSDKEISKILLYSEVTSTIHTTKFTNITLSENELKDYEPYGYRIPVRVRGNNAFNYQALVDSKHIEVLDENTGEFIFKNTSGQPANYIKAKPNTSYKVSYKVKASKEQQIHFSTFYTDGTNTNVSIQGVVGEYIEVTGTTRSDKTLSYVKFGAAGGLEKGVCFKEIQVAEELEAYEPYKEEIIYIYLKEPLRKLGTYEDYVNFEAKKVIRPVVDIKLFGSFVVYRDYIWQLNTQKRIVKTNKEMITHIPLSTSSNVFGMNNKNAVGNYVCAMKVEEAMGMTIDEFNDWIDENDVHYYAVLETPNDTETIELPNIPTFKGTNIIEIDTTITPSNMEVTYLGKK